MQRVVWLSEPWYLFTNLNSDIDHKTDLGHIQECHVCHLLADCVLPLPIEQDPCTNVSPTPLMHIQQVCIQ